MLRNVILLAVLFFGSIEIAKAANCVAEMRGQYRELITTFNAWGRDGFEACRNAEALCETDLRQRNIRGQNYGAFCTSDTDWRNPTPPREEFCNARLRSGNGWELASFQGRGFSYQVACDDARRMCENERSYRRDPRSYCEVDNYTPVPPRPPRNETRVCFADLHRNFGGVMTFRAEATGPVGTGVIDRACQMAMKQCIANSNRFDRCIERRF